MHEAPRRFPHSVTGLETQKESTPGELLRSHFLVANTARLDADKSKVTVTRKDAKLRRNHTFCCVTRSEVGQCCLQFMER